MDPRQTGTWYSLGRLLSTESNREDEEQHIAEAIAACASNAEVNSTTFLLSISLIIQPTSF